MIIGPIEVLAGQLDDSLARRTKEIGMLDLVIRGASADLAAVLRRSAVVLAASHLEGFLSDGAKAYLGHVSAKEIPSGEVYRELIVLRFQQDLTNLIKPGKTSADAASVLRKILAYRDTKIFEHDGRPSWAAGQRDHLRCAVQMLARDDASYSSFLQFAKEALFERRNRIAHGVFEAVDEAEWEQIRQHVIAVMKQFRQDLEAAAASEAYLKQTQ